MTIMPPLMSRDDLADLAEAVRTLEGETFAMRLMRLFGAQVRMLGRTLPASARKAIALATDAALKTALRVALRSLKTSAGGKPRNRLHQAAAAATGALGGAFGIAATAVELPVSTTILLRSIAEIARDNGETLGNPETGFACLNVLALGGERGQSGGRSRYYETREDLAHGLADINFMLVKQGLAAELSPLLMPYLSRLGARFGVAVTEKLAAQAVPVIGAVGGAAVNAAFAQHFQAMARGHFAVRRLERKYGAETVRFEYERLRGELMAPG
ncbi:MAG TPA: EcsC family protein [Roseiarcus sp.]|nr:EcsC family protein [Roseiarcus sp.]